MSRSGSWSTSNYLNASVAVVTVTPLTISAWGRNTSPGSYQTLAGVFGTSGASSHQHRLTTNGNNIEAYTAGGSAGANSASTSTTFAADTWFHACGVWTSATSRAAFLNGGGKGTNSNNATPTVTRTTIGVDQATGFPFQGQLAEVAIWNVALTDAEVASLALGVHPYLVRPSALVAYWPLIGTQSPEPNRLSNSAVMAINGTLTQSQLHPRVFYPAIAPARTFALAIQGLTPGLLTEPDTFYAPTVGRGVRALTAGLVTETDTFYAPAIATITRLLPGLFTETDNFYASVMSGGLLAGLFVESDVAYAASVTLGAVGLFPGLFTETDAFYAAVVNQGLGKTLLVDIFTEADTVYVAAVTTGTLSLTAPLLSDPDTVFAPTVQQAISPELFEETDTFPAQLVSVAQVLSPSLFTEDDAFQLFTTGVPREDSMWEVVVDI